MNDETAAPVDELEASDEPADAEELGDGKAASPKVEY